MSYQLMGRHGSFDAGHRVMNERMKCFNVHGHTYLYELTFMFKELEEIGYAIDFKEIKRVHMAWINDTLDHSMILNPQDTVLLRAAQDVGSKFWTMSLNDSEYCNPTVENLAKEVFLAMELLCQYLYSGIETGLRIHQVKIYETPNCWAESHGAIISDEQRKNFRKNRQKEIECYAKVKGNYEYDDRRI